MIRFMKWAIFALGLFLWSGLSGCSTPQSRSEERAEAFERLSPEDQKRVLEGQIKKGLSEDAVYIALGRPGRVLQGEDESGGLVKWIYGSTYARTQPAFSTHVMYDRRGRAYVTDVYTPYTEHYRVDTFEVIFRQGRVEGWQEL